MLKQEYTVVQHLRVPYTNIYIITLRRIPLLVMAKDDKKVSANEKTEQNETKRLL